MVVRDGAERRILHAQSVFHLPIDHREMSQPGDHIADRGSRDSLIGFCLPFAYSEHNHKEAAMDVSSPT